MDCCFLCALRDFFSQICGLFHLYSFFCKKYLCLNTCHLYIGHLATKKIWKVSDMEQSFCFLPLALLIVNETWDDTEIHLDLINHFLSEKKLEKYPQ